MKTQNSLAVCLLAGLVVATTATAQPQAGKQTLTMRDATTEDQMLELRRQAQANNPLRNMRVVEEEHRTEVYKPLSLEERTDTLTYNGLTTLVPKGAILVLPDSVKSRVGMEIPGNRLVQFQDFLRSNRGWVSTVEVTREQARGTEKLPESVTERLAKSSMMVVATFNGNPISVLPPKNPEVDQTETSTPTAAQP